LTAVAKCGKIRAYRSRKFWSRYIDIMFKRLKSHPLFDTLINLRGNPRYCVYTEPLWGIPYYLLSPFIALYMSKLGLSDLEIGAVATVTMAFQMVFSFVSGPLTDKFGRRKTTFWCDILSWSIPSLLWAFAQGFWWFVAAAVLFAVNMVSSNSWQCLLVEEADQSKLVYMFTWLTISGLVSVFLAPLSGALVEKYTVVPVMRVLYLIAFLLMTVKFFVLYFYSAETPQGKIRLAETRGVSLLLLCAQCKGVVLAMLKDKKTVRVIAIIVLFNIQAVVSGNFFPLYVTGSLGIPDRYVAYFPIIRSVVMLAFIFGAQHLLSKLRFRAPMLIGLALYAAATVFLITPGLDGLARAVIYTLFESFAYAIVAPRKDSLVAMHIDPHERARIMGLVYVLMFAASAPFGWIAGALASLDRALPFCLNIAVFCAFGAAVAFFEDVKDVKG